MFQLRPYTFLLPVQVLSRQRDQQQRVRAMTVEVGHVVDVDGGGAAAAGTKYAQDSSSDGDRAVTSGVGRNSLFAPQSDDEHANQESQSEK